MTTLEEMLETRTLELKELQQDFEEYKQFSKELEAQQEASLSIVEEKCASAQRELHTTKELLLSLRERTTRQEREANDTIARLQSDLTSLQVLYTSNKEERRRLEQIVDNLERHLREEQEKVKQLQEEKEKWLDTNMLLLSELEDKNESMQRLRDEQRDLRSELAVLETQLTSPRTPTSTTATSSTVAVATAAPLRTTTQATPLSTKQPTAEPAAAERGKKLIEVTGSNGESKQVNTGLLVSLLADMIRMIEDSDSRAHSGAKHDGSGRKKRTMPSSTS